MEKEFHFQDFRYSPTAGLTRNHLRVHLPKRALIVLQNLLENRHRVVTHQELVDACESEGTRLSVSQTISVIRSALNDSRREIIKSLYGQGFQFVSPVLVHTDTPSKKTAHSGSSSENIAGTDDYDDSKISITVATKSSSTLSVRYAESNNLIRTAFELTSKRSNEHLNMAINMLNEAGKLNPSNALIPSIQADIEVSRIIRGYVRCRSQVPRINALLNKALSIHPNLSSALATKAWLNGVIKNDISIGIEILNTLRPDASPSWLVPFYKSWLLIGQGEIDAATAELDRGLIVNPMDRGLITLKGWLLLSQGRNQDSENFLEHYLEVRPEIETLYILKCLQLLKTGRMADAQEQIHKALQMNSTDRFIQCFYAWFKAITARQSEARKFLLNCRKSESGYISPSQLAIICWALEDRGGYEAQMAIAKIDRDPWQLIAWADPRFTFKTVSRTPSTDPKSDY